jgi:DnaK suppressor protein
MDAVQTEQSFDRLTTRREHLLMTLRHLQREYEQVEQNTEWLDQAAYAHRTALLNRLNDWYLAEIKQVDLALERIRGGTYGVCAACRDAIDGARLESAPAAEFCAPCQHAREALTVDKSAPAG